ncbi:MAG: LysR family transcriptional regulator [Nitrospinaceae bacterium]|nr:MAG: LysR family transcriptional regulator [Nitrospinaceae bacterium]
MNSLNYQHLFYFRTVAVEGSVSRAAEKLFLGQPAISLQIKQLEESLGHKLFDRKNRKLILTEAGRAILDYANQIFRLGDELQEVLRDQTFTKRIHLQIGVLDSIPKKLVQLLVEAARKISDCTITVLEGEGDFLFRELLSHKNDLVVSNYPPSIGDTRQFNSRLLASSPISIFGVKKFGHLMRKFPQSLSGQPFILPTLHSKLRHDLDHFFRVSGIAINMIIETQGTGVQKTLGMEGVGLIPLPELSVREIQQNRNLLKLGTLPEVNEDFWLISSPRRIQNPVASAIFENFQLKI